MNFFIFGTAAAWALAWLIRFARSIYNSGFTGLPATLDVLSAPELDTLPAPQPDIANTGLVRVRINAPRRVRAAPGQHVFLRFLGAGVHSLTSHPFTIASVRDAEGSATRDADKADARDVEGADKRELEVVFRVHGGTTAALAARAAGKVGLSMRVLVDGPYGGVPVTLAAYDRVLLLAGGSGKHGRIL